MKKKKKPIVRSQHPAVQFLNTLILEQIKLLMDDTENIYERLHELHLENKDARGNLTYLTHNEIYDFLHEGNLKKFDTVPKQVHSAIEQFCMHLSGALNWKQFMQIYHFHPRLLQELWNIDFSEEKYESLSMDEIQFLPSYSFFVELPMNFFNKHYKGFFVFFDTHPYLQGMYGIQVMFIGDKIKTPMGNAFDCFNMTLTYDFDTVNIHSRETGETITVKMKTKEMLRLLNPTAFEQLGEEKAMEIIIKINQIITYLSCVNADFKRITKPKRAHDVKRVRVTDFEYEEWRLGDTFAKLANGNEVNTRYLGDHEDIYVKAKNPEIIENVDNTDDTDTSEEIDYYTRRTGYHMRPHMRRAHWTHYWYGKKDGSEERVKRKKFIGAVFINQTGEEIEIPTREIVEYRF